jgi:hypothetical protein
MKSMKLKELKNNLPPNRFALLRSFDGLAITPVTSSIASPSDRVYGDVEAPQSTRGRPPAQRRPPLFAVTSLRK